MEQRDRLTLAPIDMNVLRVHNGLVAQPPTDDLEHDHWKFRSDIDAVRRYGELHSDDYVEELFENEPHIRLIVLMAGEHLVEHEAALRQLVEHPRQLEVRSTPFARSRLEAIRLEVREAWSSSPHAFLQLGIGRGKVNIGLAADQQSLAATFLERYGDAVQLSVGAFPFPLAEGTDDAEERKRAVAQPRLSLLPIEEFTVTLENDILVHSGANTHGRLRIQNLGALESVIETNGGVTARVVDPKTGDGVGGFVGAQALPLVKYQISPGSSASIPLLVGTASSQRSLGYAVPPGQWAIEVPIQIEGRGQFRTPLLPISVLPSETAS